MSRQLVVKNCQNLHACLRILETFRVNPPVVRSLWLLGSALPTLQLTLRTLVNSGRRCNRCLGVNHPAVAMSLSLGCAGIVPAGGSGSASSHELPTCRSAQLFHRRSVFVRHLGSTPALGSRMALCSRQSELRPAMPRQGRLMCQARQGQVTQACATMHLMM